MSPVGCHGVGAGHGTQGHCTLVCALVAHHAHALHRQQNHASLPNLVVEVPVAEALDENVVGILKNFHFLASDVAEDAHCQARSGERMAADEMLGHAEFSSHAAHFILEEQSQRLAELKIHLLRQSAHVVVALDDRSCD